MPTNVCIHTMSMYKYIKVGPIHIYEVYVFLCGGEVGWFGGGWELTAAQNEPTRNPEPSTSV